MASAIITKHQVAGQTSICTPQRHIQHIPARNTCRRESLHHFTSTLHTHASFTCSVKHTVRAPFTCICLQQCKRKHSRKYAYGTCTLPNGLQHPQSGCWPWPLNGTTQRGPRWAGEAAGGWGASGCRANPWRVHLNVAK
jgi:hypothetical protein